MALTQVQDGMLGYDGGSFANRNRIINGDMRIDQRNAGASISATNAGYMIDRWIYGSTQAGKFTAQQTTTAPVGFKNSLKLTTASAVTIGASDAFAIEQRIEGLNCSDLGFGFSDAKTLTLSFWVRSSLTGTFGGYFINSAFNRSYPFAYTISSADTWEQKTVTVAGDTSGTWLTTNGIGIRVGFSLGTGSNYSATAGAWTGSIATSVTGATSVVGTLNATFYITGVQLEVGSVATPFEHRLYGQELALCQRYYYKWSNDNSSSNTVYPFTFQAYSTTSAFGKLIDFPVQMRSSPSCVLNGTFYPHTAVGASGGDFTNMTDVRTTSTSLSAGGFTGASGLVTGNATGIGALSNATITINAEL